MPDQAPKKNIAQKLLAIGGVSLTLIAVFLLTGVVESPTLSSQAEDDGSDLLLGKKRGHVHVSIQVKDDLWNDVQVVSATVEGHDVHLKKKANIFGQKGTLETHLTPGMHAVRWTVTKPASRSNRITLSFQKDFKVPKKGSVTVVITGQKASVY